MPVVPYLSVVIPAYNEQGRIGATLSALVRYLERAGSPPAEILVVDDGSRDGTADVVRAFERQRAGTLPAIQLLANGINRGKGYSIKHGVLLARGEFVLITDADLSTPIDEFPKLLEPILHEGKGIAIGSRALAESRIEIHQPFWREWMGKTFNHLVRRLTGLPFKDTQCGFKVMRRGEVVRLFRAARVERFAYDVEILYLARKAGLAVAEVPVIWRDASDSKVSPVRDSLVMLQDIARIVWRDRRGRYGGAARLRPAAAASPRVPPGGVAEPPRAAVAGTAGSGTATETTSGPAR